MGHYRKTPEKPDGRIMNVIPDAGWLDGASSNRWLWKAFRGPKLRQPVEFE
jgi:hypothetical protein